MTRLTGRVEKGWGSEEIWATNDRYCGKLMHFHTGARIEVSTSHSVEDKHRVAKGDSQR
jgi:hypothetical protein